MKLQKLSKLAILFLLFFVIQGFQINNAQATSSWTQTDWSGGDGQGDWSDDTKFNAEAGEGTYLQNGNLRMKINADVVVGQEDFVSGDVNQGGSAGINTLNNPYGVFSNEEKILVSDITNHRVLIYNTIPTTNNAAADVVIGQLDFVSNTANRGGSADDNTLNTPLHSFIDINGKTFIVDGNNHRVLVYNSIPTTNGASADIVIGQEDFNSRDANRGGGVADNTLNYPFAVYSDGIKLFIADKNNNRVLVYNSIPTTNGASADIVIGQEDLTSGSANQGGSADANTLSSPTGFLIYSENLFIVDNGNQRTLIYNSIPTDNNANADIVIGQEDFTEKDRNKGGAVDAYGQSGPHFIYESDRKLFISDNANKRILVFNSVPTSNNVIANEVIGQPDFTSADVNQGIGPNVFNMGSSNSVSGNSENIVMGDSTNHRVLLYNKTQVQSVLTSSTYETATEQDFGPIQWNAQTTNYSDIKMEVSTDEGLTFQEVQNNQEFIGRGTSITYKVTLISKDGLSTPTFQDISIQHQDPSNEDIDNVELKLNNKKTELQKNKRILIEKKTKISGQNTKLINGEVKIYRNKKKIEEGDVDENGNWNTDLKFKKSKKYTLTFKFYDQHGTKLDSQKYKVKIDLEDPTFTDFPANNIYKKRGAKLYWSATDNDKVKKYKATLNGKITKTKDSHIIIPQNIPTGTHTFTVKVYDKAGNTAKQSISVRVW